MTGPCDSHYWVPKKHPANSRRLAHVGFMLGQRLRRWPNIKPALGSTSMAEESRLDGGLLENMW